MSKSPDAFRTISEVADWLGVQAHVLRFWESKFSQVKPIKRAGGRRYYRPADMLLLGGIKKLLHGDGLTIKGAQKTLREHGINYVADMSQPLDDLTMAVIEGDVVETAQAAPPTSEPVVLPFEAPLPEPVDTASDVSSPPSEIMDTQEELDEAQEPVEAAEEVAEAEPSVAVELAQPEETPDEFHTEIEPVVEFEDAAPDRLVDAVPDDVDQAAPTDVEPVTEPEGIPELEAAPEIEVEPEAEAEAEAEAEDHLPGFLRNPLNDAIESAPQEDTDGPTEDIAEPAFSVTPPTAPDTEVSKPRVIDLPPLPVEQDMPASPSVLSALARLKSLDETQKQTVTPMLARLVELRSQMSNARKDARKD